MSDPFWIYLMFFLFTFFSGVSIFVLNLRHLLNSLLGLELMSLSLGLMMVGGFVLEESVVFFPMIYFIFVVVEGVLGLSFLVLLSMSHSSDFLGVLSGLSW